MKTYAVFAACLLLGCGGNANKAAASVDAAPAATPVKTAKAQRANLPITLTGPGRTVAIEQQKVRAPFNAKIVDIRVADGDHVKGGEVLGTVVSQNSEAALEGARAMMQTAHTSSQKRDARRALHLARRGLVREPLRATEAGVVLSHNFDEGALVTDREDILSIAAADSIVFVAQILQTDLPKVRAGEPTHIVLSAQPKPFPAKVHSILPTASVKDATAPVRIDFDTPHPPMAVGLFGTATIVVGEHRDALVVPPAAVLRNDVTGEKRMAIVVNGVAHWVTVTTGVERTNAVEIVSPTVADGQEVIVQGQVGLPEGAPVTVSQ